MNKTSHQNSVTYTFEKYSRPRNSTSHHVTSDKDNLIIKFSGNPLQYLNEGKNNRKIRLQIPKRGCFALQNIIVSTGSTMNYI